MPLMWHCKSSAGHRHYSTFLLASCCQKAGRAGKGTPFGARCATTLQEAMATAMATVKAACQHWLLRFCDCLTCSPASLVAIGPPLGVLVSLGHQEVFSFSCRVSVLGGGGGDAWWGLELYGRKRIKGGRCGGTGLTVGAAWTCCAAFRFAL